MKVKFIESTNKAFEPLFGMEMDIIIQMQVFMEFDPEDMKEYDFDFRKGSARTSTIKSIQYNEIARFYYEIVVETNNGTYIFRQGKENTDEPYTDEEKQAIQMAMMF